MEFYNSKDHIALNSEDLSPSIFQGEEQLLTGSVDCINQIEYLLRRHQQYFEPKTKKCQF